jgi:predicted nucleotidyltransferase component of viral defense system
LLSEICALDMLYVVEKLNDGFYRNKLVLKGGFSVRNHVPLIDHRFSFDADFNPNTKNNFTYRDVSGIRADMIKHASQRRCETKTKVTKNDARLYFIEVWYWETLKKAGHRIIERPKIEMCKTCRVFTDTVTTSINTVIDLDILGLKPPMVTHVGLEEQFSTKLFIIGSSGRQRNHFDAYDVMRIFRNNKMNLKLAKKLFGILAERHKVKSSEYIKECHHQLDAMLRNAGKRSDLENTVFRKDSFDFDEMIMEVKSLYTFSR